jgi:hypothetical protein
MDYDTCYNEDEETGEETYVGPKAVVIDLGQI